MSRYKLAVVILPYIENSSEEFLRELVSRADYVICADGGQTIARKYNIQPDVVVGDFDSTRDDFRFDCPYIEYPSEKDITDGEAVLIHARELGIREVIFAGGMGGRLDHTLGMLGTLLKFHEDFDSIRMIDLKNQVFILKSGSVVLPKDEAYRFFSVVPVFESASGITITGSKYPVTDVHLAKASTLGISNEVTDNAAEITVAQGPVYIIRSND